MTRALRMLPPTTAIVLLLFGVGVVAQGRGGADTPAPQVGAPIDLTGYWVAIISEDWRWRMVTPAKGDYASLPLTAEAKRLADNWDPAKDEAAGEQCRAYGAPGVMHGPTRLHISWLDDATLKVEADYGSQARLLQFRSQVSASGASTWQGVSVAQWILAASSGRGGGQGEKNGPSTPAPRFGSMKSVTTRLRPGYLRKNGVPYGGNAILTEYWDVHKEQNGDQWMVVTSTVEDPIHLQLPWTTALHFKKERDGGKWDPTPCSARF